MGLAEAGKHLSDIARQMAEDLKEQARNNDNEFNIRKQFLDNSVNAIKEATYGQYNILICTDQAHDDFQNLEGQILPMDLIDVEVRKDTFVNFQVYVFETGKYLRRGKWERDYIWYFGNNKKWTDIFMHIHFEVAQQKKDPNEIKALEDKQAADQKAAEDAAAATKKAEEDAAAANKGEYFKLSSTPASLLFVMNVLTNVFSGTAQLEADAKKKAEEEAKKAAEKNKEVYVPSKPQKSEFSEQS